MGCSNSSSRRNDDVLQTVQRIQNKDIKQLQWDVTDSKNESTIASIENIDFFYKITKHLGSGSFGSVYQAKQKKEPFHDVAIKKISLKSIEKLPLEYIKREVEISKQLDHPNIIKFLETYIDKENVYIVMEYCSGGSLLEWTFQEGDVLNIMKKLIYAINYMHSKNIIHRDLKLENILFENEAENSEIKIIDFGLSKIITKQTDGKRHTLVGSLAYMAPEVQFRGDYDNSCDVWSLGIIMYRLLSGELPFKTQGQGSLLGGLDFSSPVWSGISKQAIDLLKKMIVIKPKSRISIKQALLHGWFKMRKTTMKITQIIKTRPSKLQALDKFAMYNYFKQFKKEVLSIFIKNFISKDDELEIRVLFKSIDSDHKGYMTKEELEDVMKRVGINKPNTPAFAEKIATTLSNQSDSYLQKEEIIEYSEFLAASIGQDLLQNKDKLNEVFKYFDVDSKCYINQQDIKTALQREGRQLSDEKFEELIEEIDFYFNKRGEMDFQNFCLCVGCFAGATTKPSRFKDKQQQSDSGSEESLNGEQTQQLIQLQQSNQIIQEEQNTNNQHS